MNIDDLIERARVYTVADKDGEYNLGEEMERMHRAVIACNRFFEQAMPQMNVRDSALDANAIDAWNKAEIAIAKAMKPLEGKG